MKNQLEAVNPELLHWLPRLHPFQQGGLESLIRAISGLAPVGPKPELAAGVDATVWPQLRSQLIASGLITEEIYPFSQSPYLRFSPLLQKWLKDNTDIDSRLATTRQHQRHYFQFSGQLGQQQRVAAADALALATLEMPNLLTAVHGVIEQGEEWGLEFAERLLPFLQQAGHHDEHQALAEQAQQMAAQKGSEPWRQHLSNRAQGLYEAREFLQAEQTLLELIDGLGEEVGFELCSCWARIGSCRGRRGELAAAEQAYREAERLSQKLEPDQAVLEMRRSIALDLSQLCQQHEAGRWLEAAIHAHASLQQTRAAMDEFLPFIQRVEAALENDQARPALDADLEAGRKAGWTAGVEAIERLLDGERRLAELARYLDLDDAALIHRLLRNIDNSSTV